jgi:hypothetical protein
VPCLLTKAECFRKHVVIASLPGIKAGKDGWWSMPCPARSHGKPVRLCVGKSCHIYWNDLGGCPESEVLAGLVKLGFPADCLWRPNGAERKASSEQENRLASAILDIAFGGGTTTERMVAMVIAALDGEMPEGPMVGVFADRLGVSERTLYRATAEARRRNRSW